jgi:hypothetical protein
MKFLIDSASDLVHGTYPHPLDFSVSGRYIIDVPSEAVSASTQSVSDLTDAKVNSIKAAHPALPNHFNDELLAVPNVDQAQSTRFSVGPNKRTTILPGGRITTNVLIIPSPFTKVFAHFYGFLLSSVPGPVTATPAPPRLLYNHTGLAFVEFDPTLFTVELRDSTNAFTWTALPQDTEVVFSQATPFNFRLRFTNVSPDTTYHLSDWVLLWG